MGKATGIQERLLTYLHQNENIDVYLHDVVEAMPNYSREQVLRGLARMAHTMPDRLKVVKTSNIWHWSSVAKPSVNKGQVYEALATTSTGRILVEGTDGKVYMMQELS